MLWEAQGDYCVGCVGAALLESAYQLWDEDPHSEKMMASL